MIASQRKLHALIIRSSLAVSKYWLHIRNRLQRLPVFSPGDTCNNPRLTGCHGKYQEHKNSAQSSGKIPCGQCCEASHDLSRVRLHFTQYDYVVDAIDTVKGKLALVEQAQAAHTPVICSMGAGNKLDQTAFRVADIYQTSVCPLARVMRAECRKRGIRHLKVVYSTEKPTRPLEDPSISCRSHCICPPGTRKCTVRRDIPGSTAFVPSVVGLMIAGEVVKDLCGR